jgi:mono/diheme cytochrome c family protein
MSRSTGIGFAAAAAILFVAGCEGREAGPTPQAASALERGRYLVTIMDCSGCHTPGALTGAPQMQRALSGGDAGFGMPGLGAFYPPNLTPHPGADISRWSEADIVKALRTGERPDGRVLAPIMPWKAYADLSDADAAAVATYLKSLPPMENAVPPPSPLERAPAPYLKLVVPPGAKHPAGTGAPEAPPAGSAPAL